MSTNNESLKKTLRDVDEQAGRIVCGPNPNAPEVETLGAVRATLRMLSPHLRGEWRHNVADCVKALDEVIAKLGGE